MIKVLQIIESLEAGGAEKVVVDLINNMPSNIASTICCLKKSGVMAEQIEGTSHVYELNAKKGNDLGVIFKLIKIIKLEQPDIIHAHNWNTFCESIISAKLSGSKKVINTIHGHHFVYSKDLAGQIKKKIRHLVEKWLSLWSYRICCVSKNIFDYIKREIKIQDEKLQIIINGVNTKYKPTTSKNDLLKELGLKGSESIITYVGRLMPVKNLECLLKGISLAAEECPNIHLLLIGDGIMKEKLLELSAELNIERVVSFLGHKHNARDYTFISQLFVLPSFYEGTSIALLEAMAAGLPAIASEVGGNKATIIDHHSGFLFDPDNPKQLSELIIKLCKDKSSRRQMGLNAKNRIEDEYSISNVVRKYLKLYKDGR